MTEHPNAIADYSAVSQAIAASFWAMPKASTSGANAHEWDHWYEHMNVRCPDCGIKVTVDRIEITQMRDPRATYVPGRWYCPADLR